MLVVFVSCEKKGGLPRWVDVYMRGENDIVLNITGVVLKKETGANVFVMPVETGLSCLYGQTLKRH